MSSQILCIERDDLELLTDRIDQFDHLRFGNEFCFDRCFSNSETLRALELGVKVKKRISFVYPRVNQHQLDSVITQLRLIHESKLPAQIIANDFGIIEVIKNEKMDCLNPFLGRQIISVPLRSRPPMPSIAGEDSIINKLADKHLFHLTNINYRETSSFLKNYGIKGMEFDYIPETFPFLVKLKNIGFEIQIHFENVMVAVTRRCHTKRMSVKNEECRDICKLNKYSINNKVTGPLFLEGNAILSFVPHKPEHFKYFDSVEYALIKSYDWIREQVEL